MAGVAAADVTVTGSVEMGVIGGDTIETATGVVKDRETQFHTVHEITFNMSGETDGGLAFGASVQLDEAAASTATDDGGASVFIKGAFGTLTMGDTDGALDWAMTEVPIGAGSIADDETGHAGFNGNAGRDGTYDGQVARYDYSFGDFGVAVSVEIDDETGANHDDPVLGLGFRYAANGLSVGLGYQKSETAAGVSTEATGISLGYTMDAFTVGANYSQQTRDGAPDQTHMGLGVAYETGALTLAANYGSYEDRGNVAGTDTSGFGLSAGYDLGGGASLLFGYGSSSVEVAGVKTDAASWSLGLSMSF